MKNNWAWITILLFSGFEDQTGVVVVFQINLKDILKKVTFKKSYLWKKRNFNYLILVSQVLIILNVNKQSDADRQ